MARFADVVVFLPASSGTGSFVVSAAVTGFQRPVDAGMVDGGKYKYRAESQDLTQWEVGEGTYTVATTTLARTTILFSSNANAVVNFTAAPNVGVVTLKEDMLALDEANSFTAAQQSQAQSNLGLTSPVGQLEWWPCSDLYANRLKADGASYSRTTYATLFNVLVKSGTATFTNGSANVGMTAHGRSVNDPIKLFTTGTLPTNFTAGTHGLVTAGTVYYVKTVVDANTVTLAATAGGTAVSAGSAGSGTHTWVCAPHGDGDGSTTFTVPDYRGGFLRALDNGAGVDTNRSVGSLQLDMFQGHIHTATQVFENFASGSSSGTLAGTTGTTLLQTAPVTGTPQNDGSDGSPRFGSETRPRNVAALVTIRYAT